MKPLRKPFAVAALTLFAVLVLAGQAHAQTSLTSPTLYRLDKGSTYQSGCFPPCLCPMLEQVAVRGTMTVEPAGSDPLFTYYKISDVNWTAATGDPELRITGTGKYSIGGEFALVHRLEMDLVVGNNLVQHFDSGTIPVGDSRFPAIDITISINNQYCFDTVFHVVASPVPPDQIRPYRLLKETTFQRGCFGFCDCLLGPEQPVAGTFRLVELAPSPLFREFAVVDVRWSVGSADATTPTPAPTPIRGFGTYRIGGEFALQHRLGLDLLVGDEPLTHYDSGLDQPTTRFPRIDADISIGDLTCYDTLIRVHAAPRHHRLTRLGRAGATMDPAGAMDPAATAGPEFEPIE